MNKIKLSHTAATTYRTCPKKYKLRYLDKLREKRTSSALLFGKAIDNALNALVEGKDCLEEFRTSWEKQNINEVTEDLRSSENVKYFKSDIDASLLAFDEEVIKELLQKKVLSDAEQVLFNQLAFDSLSVKGEMLLSFYIKEVFPKIKKVLSVQSYFSIANEENDELIGYIDMICEWEDGRIVIFDHKTKNGTYEENSVTTSPQLATYLFALAEKYKATHAGYIVLDKNIRKRDPRVRHQILINEISSSFIEKTVDDLDNVLTCIKEQKFEENLESCYGAYGPCEYYQYCKFNSKKGLVDLKK